MRYWESISEIVQECIDKYPDIIDGFSSVVSSNFAGLIRSGASNLALGLAESVATKRHWDWEALRETIRMMSWRNGWKQYPESIKIRLSQLKEKLTKNDFISKFRDAAHFDSGSWEEEMKKKVEFYKNQAHVFVNEEGANEVLLKQLILDTDIKPYAVFGEELYNLVCHDNLLYRKISHTIISAVAEKQDFCDNVLIGFGGHSSQQVFDEIYPALLEKIPEALFSILAIRHTELESCSILFELVSSERVDIRAFKSFCMFCDWNSLGQEKTISFFDKLAYFSPEGAFIALDRIKAFLYRGDTGMQWQALVDEYKKNNHWRNHPCSH